MKNFLIWALFMLALGVLSSQTACSDKLSKPEPLALCDTLAVSYNIQIKDIIDTYCAIPTCHIPGGEGPGVYTSYESMSLFLTDDLFKRFVVDFRNDPELGMPPNRASNPGPKDLTQEDFDIISCWIEKEYPEN